MPRATGKACRHSLLAFAALAACPQAAQAVDRISAAIARIEAESWRLAGLEISVETGGPELTGTIGIGELRLPDGELVLEDIRVDCGRVVIAGGEFACLEAAIALDSPAAGRLAFGGELRYRRASGEASFDLRGIQLASGRLSVEGIAGTERLRLAFTGTGLALPALAAIAAPYARLPEDFALSAGTVDLAGDFDATGRHAATLALNARLAEASGGNEAGTVVSEALTGSLEARASRAAAGWQFEARIEADGGETYVEPVYADLAQTPLELEVRGSLPAGPGPLHLDRLFLSQASVLTLQAQLDLALPSARGGIPVASGRIELGNSSFSAIYENLLQVFAAGTMLGELETRGTVSGVLALEENRLASAVLTLGDLDAEDRRGRFAVHGLQALIHWPGADGEPGDGEPTRLSWDAASAYTIPLGRASIEAALGGDDLLLLAPLTVPLLGGALQVNRLEMRDYGTGEARGVLDARLEPVELGGLTAAFGWPAFSGELSGRLPLLRYEGDVMTVGGTLSARAFGGEIEFSNLTLEQPFGLVPRLSGDLRLRHLDLEQLTDTFSFGLIQGRLSGDVTGLQMIGWRPVAMDLHLYTPEGDRSRRRISQRAVENLASVGGGGAAAALSSGFMKFFEVFAYEKIGIRCILADGICRMSGAGPAGESALGAGYYIVRGSGLPRIDVVGYRHQVSWTQLVNQLAAIMDSGGPVVN